MLAPALLGLWTAVGPANQVSADAPDEIEAASDSSVATSEPAPTRPVADALDVQPGATCLEPQRLAEQVVTWLGHRDVDARITVEVRGDPDEPTRLHFSVRLDDEVIAVRRFDPAPSRCEDLHAVVGLAIAMAIAATLLEAMQREEQPPKPEPPPQPEPPPEPEPPEQPSPSPVPTAPPPPAPRQPPKPRAWTLRLGLGGGLGVDAPPKVGGLGRLGLGASWRELVDLRASVLGGSSGRQSTGSGRTAIALVAGELDVCIGPPVARILRFRGCAGLLAGAALATGHGFVDDRTSRLPWVAVALGADMRVRVATRLELELAAQGLANAVRPAFDFLAPGDVRRVGRQFGLLGGLFSAGLVVRLW